MAVYSVEGKLGTGKTKVCVWQAQQALRQGRRVAGNVNLFLDKLTPERASSYIRIPDRPTPHDLEAIGHGNPGSYDESKNGVLLRDELGTWLNSRSFQDKARAGILDWLIHARKLGWDVYLIVQSAQMIDKQVREALIEYECRCLRLDKVRIPLVGWFFGAFVERWGYLPRFHLVTARVGYGAGAIVADRWTYRGDDLHAAYDTRQVFKGDEDAATYTALPPWDFKRPVSWRQSLALRFGPRKRPAPRPKLPEVQAIMALPAEARVAAWRRLFGAVVGDADAHVTEWRYAAWWRDRSLPYPASRTRLTEA